MSVDADKELARQCLQFKGCSCDNKECLNYYCPLNCRGASKQMEKEGKMEIIVEPSEDDIQRNILLAEGGKALDMPLFVLDGEIKTRFIRYPINKAYRKSDKYKAYQKAYKRSDKFKAYEKAYYQRKKLSRGK